MLTTGADTITGTAGNDIINSGESLLGLNAATPVYGAHLNATDVIDGGAGTDTLKITTVSAITQVNPTISNVENVVLASGGNVTLDTTNFNGVTSLSTTKSVAADLDAATTTDVSVAGASGAISIDGGKNITVTDETKDTDITIGANAVSAGSVTVTATNVGQSTIAVDGGTGVTITATGSDGGADAITVGRGGAATDLPSGAILVTSNAASKAGTDEDLVAIQVSGGSTITVNQVATSTVAATDKTGATATLGAVEVDAGNATTTITVTQTPATTEVVAVDAVAAKADTQKITFQAIKNAETVTVTFDAGDTIVFTAAKDLTAAQVASAFANITSGAIQGSAASSLGSYTYTGTMDQGWTSGAVATVDDSNSTVTFSNAAVNPTALTVGDTSATGNMSAAAVVTGTAEVKAVTGVQGVTVGAVTIDENATASVTTITVDGYATGSTIGNTTATTKLDTLTLANAAKDVTMVVTDTADTLSLSLNKMGTSTDTDEAVLTFTAAPKTLNITNTGDNYVDLTAAATETLTVAGTGKLNIADLDLAAVKSVTVTGSAGLVLSGQESNTLTSVTTSGTTGSVTSTIDGAVATYTGGSGVDTVTLATSTALTKAINTGAGDDTVVFGVAVTGSTAALNGGDGTDTLSMTNANAAALDNAVQTFYSGFERLTLNDVYSDDIADAQETNTINLANLGLASYVVTSGTLIDASDRAGESDILALDKVAANATVVLTADGLVTATLADATGTADVINVAMSSDGATTGGNFTVAGVETVNISVNDVFVDANNDGKDDTNAADTLTLTAAAATKVTVSGSADLNLTMTGSTKVATIDASAMTGKLTVISVNTASATTITGGSGDDTITGAADNDVLVGGAGADKLTAVGELTTLTGGAGNDTFVMNTADSVNGYATITDLTAGDVIDTDAATFTSTKVTLGDTAVFQDYANAAVNAVAADGAIWFQYASNTYLVVDSVADNSTSFTNGSDQIIKIAGLVDLSTAVFNATTGDLTIA